MFSLYVLFTLLGVGKCEHFKNVEMDAQCGAVKPAEGILTTLSQQDSGPAGGTPQPVYNHTISTVHLNLNDSLTGSWCIARRKDRLHVVEGSMCVRGLRHC